MVKKTSSSARHVAARVARHHAFDAAQFLVDRLQTPEATARQRRHLFVLLRAHSESLPLQLLKSAPSITRRGQKWRMRGGSFRVYPFLSVKQPELTAEAQRAQRGRRGVEYIQVSA